MDGTNGWNHCTCIYFLLGSLLDPFFWPLVLASLAAIIARMALHGCSLRLSNQ
jgi:hypothetical protein